MDIKEYMQTVGRQARAASRRLAGATTAEKNAALLHIAAAIRREKAALVAANQEDLAAARAAGLDTALLDRLTLSEKGVDGMAEGVEQVATLADPIGEMTDIKYRPSGIQVGKMRVPLGVIGIIYEARPNVTADAAALCLKSGNAAILRGGSEAIRSNRAIAALVQEGLKAAGLPAESHIKAGGNTRRSTPFASAMDFAPLARDFVASPVDIATGIGCGPWVTLHEHQHILVSLPQLSGHRELFPHTDSQ